MFLNVVKNMTIHIKGISHDHKCELQVYITYIDFIAKLTIHLRKYVI